MRKWVCKAERDTGELPGATSEEQARIKVPREGIVSIASKPITPVSRANVGVVSEVGPTTSTATDSPSVSLRPIACGRERSRENENENENEVPKLTTDLIID